MSKSYLKWSKSQFYYYAAQLKVISFEQSKVYQWLHQNGENYHREILEGISRSLNDPNFINPYADAEIREKIEDSLSKAGLNSHEKISIAALMENDINDKNFLRKLENPNYLASLMINYNKIEGNQLRLESLAKNNIDLDIQKAFLKKLSKQPDLKIEDLANTKAKIKNLKVSIEEQKEYVKLSGDKKAALTLKRDQDRLESLLRTAQMQEALLMKQALQKKGLCALLDGNPKNQILTQGCINKNKRKIRMLEKQFIASKDKKLRKRILKQINELELANDKLHIKKKKYMKLYNNSPQEKVRQIQQALDYAKTPAQKKKLQADLKKAKVELRKNTVTAKEAITLALGAPSFFVINTTAQIGNTLVGEFSKNFVDAKTANKLARTLFPTSSWKKYKSENKRAHMRQEKEIERYLKMREKYG